ncbi:ornithine decarboxylase antizyme 1-like [Daphnia pulicaria]|uniref:ornithine decarboxylase antizyme 1-like n=1 Tax=Daphnia pulicaria TaxID=35523 RepID=UPI001EEB2A91|nr:ornithine decarboxylase antizyme 1-like [Daphnia pulicaria]
MGWGWGLGGGPDVPHAANNQVGSTPPEGLSSSHGGVGNNHNNKQQQQLSANSQEVIQQQQHIGAELVKASRQQPTRLAFVLELTATRDWRWEGVLWRGRLYLEVPSRLVQTGSKEGFVALLEYAEEELQCSHVILALSKDRADRADVIRTFMFLGFSILPPGHQLVPANSNNLFLACSLE